MSVRRSRRALLLACLLLSPPPVWATWATWGVGAAWAASPALAATAATPAAERASPERGPLVVQSAGWVFPSRPLKITLEQRGVLSGRRLAIDLFIDGNQLERVATKADRTRTRTPTTGLAPGRHVLMAKAGREVATTEFRVIAWLWLAAAVAGLLVLGGAGVALARARRRSRPDSI